MVSSGGPVLLETWLDVLHPTVQAHACKGVESKVCSSPVHINVIGPPTPRQFRDVARGGPRGLCRGDRERLLHAASAQVYRGNGLLLGLPQVAQQVVERQPGKTPLVSTCKQLCCWITPLPSQK